MHLIRAFARPLLAAPFILAGLDAATKPETHRARIANLNSLAEKVGLSLPQGTQLDPLTRSTGIVMTLAGTAFATSKLPRLSAALLGALQIPVALANNPFWQSEGAQRRADLLGLASAAGLVGGAVIAAYDREGRPSVAWRAEKWAGEMQAAVSDKLSEIGK